VFRVSDGECAASEQHKPRSTRKTVVCVIGCGYEFKFACACVHIAHHKPHTSLAPTRSVHVWYVVCVLCVRF
jgi:hypothetical protein